MECPRIQEGGGHVGRGGLGTFILIVLIGMHVGAFVGATLLRPIEPRSLLAWQNCQDRSCLRLNELTGLFAAVGIKLGGSALPSVVRETPYSLVVRHPFPQARVHFLIVPKKDVKNIGELRAEDQVYLTDAYAVMQSLVKDEQLKTYLIKTNGPGYQDVAYLHFHLIAE